MIVCLRAVRSAERVRSQQRRAGAAVAVPAGGAGGRRARPLLGGEHTPGIHTLTLYTLQTLLYRLHSSFVLKCTSQFYH